MNTKHTLALVRKFFPDKNFVEAKIYLNYRLPHQHLFTALNMMDYYTNQLKKGPNPEMQGKLDALRFFVGEWLG